MAKLVTEFIVVRTIDTDYLEDGDLTDEEETENLVDVIMDGCGYPERGLSFTAQVIRRSSL